MKTEQAVIGFEFGGFAVDILQVAAPLKYFQPYGYQYRTRGVSVHGQPVRRGRRIHVSIDKAIEAAKQKIREANA